jgi:hypothetical protein
MNANLLDRILSLNSPALELLIATARWKEVPTFFERIKVMLKGAGVKDQLRLGVWTESAMTMTSILNLILIKNKEVSPNEFYFAAG